MATLQLQDILYSQGFGTRRGCHKLIRRGEVAVGGASRSDPEEEFETAGLRFEVQGEIWDFRQPAYLMLHKPAGTECSQSPSSRPSVYSLLPEPLRQRPRKGSPGVQAIGRLDHDTTGLLLLSDDGQFIHRMSSPRHHVVKVYEVGTQLPVDDEQIRLLLDGVVLDDSPAPVRAVAAERVAATHLRLTLGEGKYHQVKRMLVAVGSQVVSLHRSAIGELVLPADLAPGGWRWLDAAQLRACQAGALSASPDAAPG